MDKLWLNAAKYCAKVYGSEINLEEEYFICPECGEPIYACDWPEEEFVICPVCDFHF